MKNYGIVKSFDEINSIIIPFPSKESLSDIIKDLNRGGLSPENGEIYFDLLIFTGYRKGRFVKAIIKQGIIDVNTLSQVNLQYDDTITIREFAKMNENSINKIYPIAFRNNVLTYKRENGFV